MLIKSIVDLCILYLIWMAAYLSLKGLGYFVAYKILNLSMSNTIPFLEVWLGVLLVTTLAEIVNYFSPINWKFTLIITIVGCAFYYKKNKNNFKYNIQQLKNNYVKNYSLISLIIFIILLWSFKLLDPSSHGDAGFYHLQTIKWVNEYPIVFGLGNLFSRLAYNQSYFIFASIFNWYPFWNHGYISANFFLTIIVFLTCYFLLQKIKFGKIFFVFLILSFIPIIQNQVNPAPDFTVTLFQILIFTSLIIIINGSLYNVNRIALCVLIFFLCIYSITIKISAVIFSITSLLILIYECKYLIQKNIYLISKVLILSIFVCVIHFFRGYILSGYPFFPISFAGIPELKWAMPISVLKNESDWIYSWARMPDVDPSTVIGNWKWLRPWLENFPPISYIPILLSAFILVIIYSLNLFNMNLKKINSKNIFLFFLLFNSILFWFFTAPDVRFLGAIPGLFLSLSLWIFYLEYSRRISDLITAHAVIIRIIAVILLIAGIMFIFNMGTGLGLISQLGLTNFVKNLTHMGVNQQLILILLALLISRYYKNSKNKILIYLNINKLLLIFIWINIFKYFFIYLNLDLNKTNGWTLSPNPLTELRVTNSNFKINVPIDGARCWETPLPCTPYFDKNLSSIDRIIVREK